ncbi:dnaK protein [Trichomonas vaginalis G3]|uniref:DnaK protein n=1 Tax=Trichomonas vaginalis (strain ATCC PRA-98 / G3) TaxID=412133 RepID=A2DNI4_TRIV3|nr:ATP binding [Trichomonas vaginalis G3]EAY17987.1 dnaK protein [Trichomonas vaginalis G3]KAI5499071.1 ATP binding [Trichomonas vaginalis G3]|eukprot:XP_001578973.1 dnaK protein [Trichomonas vaginalis G3]
MAGVGIDLGNTFSKIAIQEEGRNHPVTIVIDGAFSVPSIVGFIGDEVIFGQRAKEYKDDYEKNVIYDTKRALGIHFDDPEIQDYCQSWPFNTSADENGYIQYDICRNDGMIVHQTPESITTLFLNHLMFQMNRTQIRKVGHAVIAIPTYFSNIQQEKIRAAAESAGIRVVSLIPESFAAAIAYGRLNHTEQKLLIFDFSGTSLSVSVIEINMNNGITEISTAIDPNIGGHCIDNNLVRWVLKKLEEEGIILNNNSFKKLSIIQDACEKAKINLSNRGVVRTNITFILDNHEYNYFITKRSLETINSEIFERLIPTVEEALQKANLTRYKITDIIAVGDSSKINAVIEKLTDFFDKEPLYSDSFAHVEAIACGAAKYCKMKLQEGGFDAESE